MSTDPPEAPEEFFLDGPMPDGEDLLRRTVAAVHRHAARSARLRVALLALGVVVAGALVMGSGMALGRWTDQPTGGGNPVVATDSARGATLSATLARTDGGSRLSVTVTGLPVGTTCRLSVVDTTGDAWPDGSWRIGPGHRAVTTTAWPAPREIAAVRVTTSAGVTLTASVRTAG